MVFLCVILGGAICYGLIVVIDQVRAGLGMGMGWRWWGLRKRVWGGRCGGGGCGGGGCGGNKNHDIKY